MHASTSKRNITYTERKQTQYDIPAKHKSNDKCFPISCVIDHLGQLKIKYFQKWARALLEKGKESKVEAKLTG
jgi:predicted TIM-barrel fold metal-dependent hydrolase